MTTTDDLWESDAYPPEQTWTFLSWEEWMEAKAALPDMMTEFEWAWQNHIAHQRSTEGGVYLGVVGPFGNRRWVIISPDDPPVSPWEYQRENQ